jgi:hypothetical protein
MAYGDLSEDIDVIVHGKSNLAAALHCVCVNQLPHVLISMETLVSNGEMVVMNVQSADGELSWVV